MYVVIVDVHYSLDIVRSTNYLKNDSKERKLVVKEKHIMNLKYTATKNTGHFYINS